MHCGSVRCIAADDDYGNGSRVNRAVTLLRRDMLSRCRGSACHIGCRRF